MTSALVIRKDGEEVYRKGLGRHDEKDTGGMGFCIPHDVHDQAGHCSLCIETDGGRNAGTG